MDKASSRIDDDGANQNFDESVVDFGPDDDFP